MQMPNKKTRHKLKMGLMVVQVLLGIIAPSVSSVSKVMADTSEVTQQNNTSEYISDDETNKDEVAQWVTKVGAQINEQDDTNMLLGASTNTDGGFFFTTAKKNDDGSLTIIETTIRTDKSVHIKLMIQKDNQITSTQNFDNLALDISNGGINLKNNDNNQSVELTEGTQSDAASIAGNLAGVFAGMGANASELFSVAFSGGPVAVIGTLVIAGVMVGFMSYKVYKVYQNNQLIRTERASRNLATAVRNKDTVNTNRYSAQIKKSSGYINTSSLNNYYSSNSVLNANLETLRQISYNMKPIYIPEINFNISDMAPMLNQLTAMNAYLDLMAKDMAEMNAQITRDMQNMISRMNKLNQELAEINKELEAANVEIAEAVKGIHEMVTHWDELAKQYAINVENDRKNLELNDVPDPRYGYIDKNTITKKILDSKNNTLEINGIYKQTIVSGGKIRAEVTEIGNLTFSHLDFKGLTHDGTKNYYFDLKDDHTFNTKIKLDNFVVNGTQLYEVRYYIELNRDDPAQTHQGTESSLLAIVDYNSATGKEVDSFVDGEGMEHDPIHVIPKIDPIVPDKGAVIQGKTDPNRDVEININGKWTDSVQSDDKGIFRFPPKDLNFNDSVYIEVIPKEVSGKYLEGRTIYLTMDRSSAQYKKQYLANAQHMDAESLAKYLPEGWTIDPVETSDGKRMLHIKDPELAKHIQDILDNTNDAELRRQLEKIKQEGQGYRIRIDQADGKTPYQHMHKYNDDGLLMNEEGEAVDYKLPEGHIKYDYELPEKSVIEDIKEGLASEATKGKWLTEGTAKKFLSTNGTFFVGLHKLDGKYYYFDPENGGLLTGNITTDKGKKLVADPDTGIIDFDMAMKIDDKYYLVNPSDLSNKTGFQKTTINGVSGYYYFDDKTGAMTSEDKTINGDKYYFEKETGRVKTGWIETDTGKKYLDENGLSYFKRLHLINGASYIFDDNGNLLIGKIQHLVKDDSYRKVSEYNSKYNSIPGSLLSNWYLFATDDGKLVEEKEFSVDNKYYYAGAGGGLETGYVYMDYLDNNKIVYFDDVTFAKVTDSTYHIRVLPEIFPDDLYHTRDILSGKDGFLVSGLQQIFSNGKLITVYYSPKSKRMLHGEYDIDGQHYSFDRKTGALAAGLHVFDGKTYYVKPEGSLAMNEEQRINDSYYFFDKDGVMQTGFVDLTPNGQNKKVYYGSDGKMLYGQQKIGDDYYLFEHGTGKMFTVFQNLKDYGQDKVSYFDPKTGAMVHDQIVVDGIKYKLDNASGWHNGGVIPGWTDDGTDKYYVGDDGKIMHGQQRVGNDIYLFSNDTGALQTGFQNLKDYGQDKICYFDPKTGAMVHDQVTVDGITYKLDDAASWHNGALISGVANVDLIKYFTKNPGQVVIKNDDFIYSNTLFTDKVKAVKAGDVVNVQAIEYSPNGYPRLKVEGGYLTANRSFVGKATPSQPNITVQAFVQNDGWQSPVQENQIAGTVEQGKRLEAFKVKITNMQDTYQGDAIYQAHVAGIGWQSEVKNDELAGTIDQARQVEALKMHLTGELADKYDLYYRVQVQNYGWLDWASNNGVAGTTGMGLRVEAIEFTLNPKGQQFTGNTTRPSIEK